MKDLVSGIKENSILTEIHQEIAPDCLNVNHLDFNSSVPENILDTLLEGCQILDYDLTYRYLNRAAEVHNCRPNSELLGKNYLQMWPGSEDSLVFKRIAGTLADRIPCRFDNKFIYPDGKLGWFDLNLQPVPACILILSIDITERKIYEQALLDSKARLEEVNKELESFTYSVSHDLRAPLRHINGYVDLLKAHFAEQLPETGKHYLETIASSALQMGKLIQGLLDFSRTGRHELFLTKLNMNTLLHDALVLLKPEWEGRTIDFRIQDLPEVYGDLFLIRTVWYHLMSNAVKFTSGKDKAVIEVFAAVEKDKWIFSVKDNGVGFDMKYAGKLFGIFQRLHSMHTYPGTGIGLANVRMIINKHGGSVWADAQPEQGATFSFTLSKVNTYD